MSVLQGQKEKPIPKGELMKLIKTFIAAYFMASMPVLAEPNLTIADPASPLPETTLTRKGQSNHRPGMPAEQGAVQGCQHGVPQVWAPKFPVRQ